MLSITQSFRRRRMNFNDETVGPDGNGSLAENFHEIGATAALARIDDDREVGFELGGGDGPEVEGVARVGFERADTAFAEDDVRVAVGQDVFGGQKPLFEAHAESAFEEDGFAAAGAGDEELEVLRIAGADLQNIGGSGDEIDITFGQDFGDDTEAGFRTGFGQKFKTFRPETLELVGGGAGFESAATEDGGAGGFD